MDWLSEDERRRATDFRFACHRERFVLSHAFTRWVLAAYLNVHPREVPLIHSSTGKPCVASGATAAGESLGFNLAHCATHAVVAVAPTIFVGVDVEHHQGDLDVPGIAERYFARSEAEMLRALPRTQADANFLRLWTCKEAFVKAIGLGLVYPLNRFVVSEVERGKLEYSQVESAYGPASSWSLGTLMPTLGCYVAVAVRLIGAVVTLTAGHL